MTCIKLSLVYITLILRKLSVDTGTFGAEGIDFLELIEALKLNTGLTEIAVTLSEVNAAPMFIKELSEAIEQHPTLEKLNLSKNYFTDRALGYLVEALSKNSCLKELHIGSCINESLDVNKALKLIAGLFAKGSESEIQILDIGGFNLEEEGYDGLLKLLQGASNHKNAPLKRIIAENIDLPFDGIAECFKLWVRNPYLDICTDQFKFLGPDKPLDIVFDILEQMALLI